MSALFRKIQKAEFTYPSWFTPPVRALLDKILIADPLKRASISDLEADPWFIGPDGGGPADARPSGAARPPGAMGTGGAAGAHVVHVPSAKDIDDAVEDVDEDAGKDDAPKVESGPRTLNAFDVVNIFGGMSLNRLLETGDKTVVTSQPQFLSALPAHVIMRRLHDGLAAFGASEVKVDEKAFKMKARILTARGEIVVVAVIYGIAESLQLVEVRQATRFSWSTSAPDHHHTQTLCSQQLLQLTPATLFLLCLIMPTLFCATHL
jgi:hypothetical protein